MKIVVALAVVGSLASSSAAAARSKDQSGHDALCSEWHQCRDLALAAADRKEYETFHDLAWRAVQTGPRSDPALMYLLARAQALSGRPHDALVMLTRLAEMGVAADAAASEDFGRTRQLAGWPELAARIERLKTPESPPAAAVERPVEPVPSPASARSPAGPIENSVRFSTERFAVGGLAYDAVSGRFVVGDRQGRKLLVVRDGSDHFLDLVRAESAGFRDIVAIEIDAKRGDLWVASTAAGDNEGTLHKLQLVSGRPLKTFPVAADRGPLTLVDLAVTPAGMVILLDAAGDLFILRPAATSVERVMRIEAADLVSVTAGGDDHSAYVAHRDGLSRLDLQEHTVTRLTAPRRVSLAGIERIRWHRGALIAVQRDDSGLPRISKLQLNDSGAAVTKSTAIEASIPNGAQSFVNVAGDELVYLVAASDGSAAPDGSRVVEFVAHRIQLR